MYLKHLVEAISITPSNECMLRDPQILLDSALTNGDDDPSQEVEQVTEGFSPRDVLVRTKCCIIV